MPDPADASTCRSGAPAAMQRLPEPPLEDAPSARGRASHSKDRDYASEPQQVVLTLIAALLDTWPEPQNPTSLAGRTGYSRDQVYRGLKNLALQRMADESPAGWLIGPVLTAAPERIRQRTALLLNTYLGSPT